MSRVGKYIFIIVAVCSLLVGGIFFFLKKDGYKVTFNSNGGSIVESVTTGFKKTVLKPEDPMRVGYHFMGWYLDGEKFNFSSKIEENITLTAVWEEEEEVIYTVLFDSLSDDDYELEVKEGETIRDVPTPEKEGYQFLYWCYHNKEFDFSTPIKSNMVMVAKYQKIDHEKEVVIVSFDSDGGSKIDNQEIEVGSQALEPKEPVKEGYRFMGWYLGKEKFDFKEEVKEDITLVALWEEE